MTKAYKTITLLVAAFLVVSAAAFAVSVRNTVNGRLQDTGSTELQDAADAAAGSAAEIEFEEIVPPETELSATDELPKPETDPEPDPERDAVQLELTVRVDGIRTRAPVDGDIYSIQRFEPGAVMQLLAEDSIGSLYLVWNELPGSFTVSIDGNVQSYDGSRYLHQFISLPGTGKEVVLTAPDYATELCEVYAFTAGRVPDWVQQWRSLEDGEFADIMLFPTHADDEYLFFGGIIPYYAGELGLNVQVVYMTQHTGDAWFRNHELLNGLWAGGDDIYPVINAQRDILFTNVPSASRYYGSDTFKGFQAEQIRRYRPLVVVGHDYAGEYGHCVHIFNTLCLTEAVELAADSEAFPESAEKYGIWDVQKLYLHLYPENPVILDFETPLENFNGLTAFEAAELAYGEYVSQHEWFPSIFGSGTAYDCHSFGLLRTTVGYDTGCDLMENTSR